MKRLLIGLFGKAAFILAVLLTGSLPAQAESDNPFGFETNKDPLQYEYCKKVPKLLRNYGYRCGSAPRPHPDFEWYNLQFVKGVGLCRIRAGAQNFALDMEFNDLVEVFKGQIAQKYGSPTKDTKQENESIDESPQAAPRAEGLANAARNNKGLKLSKPPAWLSSGAEQPGVAGPQERHVQWSPAAGFKGLGDVKSIELEAHERSKGFSNSLYVLFRFVTFDDCMMAIDNIGRRAF